MRVAEAAAPQRSGKPPRPMRPHWRSPMAQPAQSVAPTDGALAECAWAASVVAVTSRCEPADRAAPQRPRPRWSAAQALAAWRLSRATYSGVLLRSTLGELVVWPTLRLADCLSGQTTLVMSYPSACRTEVRLPCALTITRPVSCLWLLVRRKRHFVEAMGVRTPGQQWHRWQTRTWSAGR